MSAGTLVPEIPSVDGPVRTAKRPDLLGMIGACLVIGVVLFAVVGPWLITSEPNAQNLGARLLPVWSTHDGVFHLLGTDPLGRDVAARLATGARGSLIVAGAALVLGGGLGIVLGTIAGYVGGWVDVAISRIVDAQLALPNLIFAMVIAASLGRGMTNTVIALGVSTWPTYARLLRSQVLTIKNQEYIAFAKMLGRSSPRIMLRHVVPNALNVALVVASLELGRMILVESSLSFVGLGIQPPDASLGAMIRDGQQYVYTDARLATIPGVLIMLTVLGLNISGDWLRDRLDPRES